MADPTGFLTSADITSALATLFYDTVIVAWNRSCPEMAFVKARRARAKNCTWDVKFPVDGTDVPSASAAGGKFTDGAAVTVVRKDLKIPAVLNFANYHEAFGLTAKAEAQAEVTNNPSDLRDLYGDEYKDALSRLAVVFMEAFYNGDGSTDEIHGLLAVGASPMDDTGAYAGIDPATPGREKWAGNPVDAQGAAINFDWLRRLRRGPVDAMGVPPHLYVMKSGMFDAIAELYDNNRRFVDEVTRGDGAKVRVDGAVEMMTWQGARMIWSPRYPNFTSIMAWNLDELVIEQLPHNPNGRKRDAVLVPLQSMAEEQMGVVRWPLQVLLQPLAIAGTAYNFDLQMFPQVVVQQRNAHGILENLASAE